jgi:hypothetical protein
MTGNPYGFEIFGVTSTNLGGVLGLHNGDIITEVSNQPTETYNDLLDVAAIVLSAIEPYLELTDPGEVRGRHRKSYPPRSCLV